MLKHCYDYEVTCMQVSIVCMDNGIQSDSIVTTQHSNPWLCEHACICSARSRNLRNPRIALRNPGILTLARNPRIAHRIPELRT